MNSDSLNMVSKLGDGHMLCTFFLSEPQLKTTVYALTYFFQIIFSANINTSLKKSHQLQKN